MVSIFALGSKGFNAIKNLHTAFGAGFISLVISSRDKNIEHDFYDETLAYCEENGISVADKQDRCIIETAYVIAIGWRWLINHNGNYKVIVFHDSLLPKYRGFAPLVNYLVNGE